MKPFVSPELSDVAPGGSLPLMRSSAQSEQPIHPWLLSVVVASGCFNPVYDNPTCGPNHECPTDFVCIDNTCRHSDGPAGGATADAASAPFCAADPRLRLCYSFDQESLPAALPDEGAAVVDAQLTNAIRIARGSGGAAQLDTTSSIFVPMTPEVTNIQALEIWYRADADPPNGGRIVLLDSNVSPPNISLNLYRQDPGHQLRCGLGTAVAIWDAPLTVGSWTYLACVCEADSLKMYVDGVKIGETPGPCASGGAVVADGFTIGSNNNGGPSGFNDWLVGAIDGVRLWNVPLTSTTICQTAGKPSC
jgi:Concanavalin A-like lectin/glucanases superfamily